MTQSSFGFLKYNMYQFYQSQLSICPCFLQICPLSLFRNVHCSKRGNSVMQFRDTLPSLIPIFNIIFSHALLCFSFTLPFVHCILPFPCLSSFKNFCECFSRNLSSIFPSSSIQHPPIPKLGRSCSIKQRIISQQFFSIHLSSHGWFCLFHFEMPVHWHQDVFVDNCNC